VLLRLGRGEVARTWLRAVQELTREGPFGQAHMVWPEGARKASFFNGNVYFNAAGAAFAAMLLDDLELAGSSATAPPAAEEFEGAAPA
jgi:hypothetical protein